MAFYSVFFFSIVAHSGVIELLHSKKTLTFGRPSNDGVSVDALSRDSDGDSLGATSGGRLGLFHQVVRIEADLAVGVGRVDGQLEKSLKTDSRTVDWTDFQARYDGRIRKQRYLEEGLRVEEDVGRWVVGGEEDRGGAGEGRGGGLLL